MCRIFGFRSILQSGVHSSLIEADNAIAQQSQNHPDGWGVAYYKLGSPHLIKMDSQARECHIFKKVSGVVSSDTVLAHIRKSTVGDIGPLNTHPFQYGRWIFAHNGNIENFANKAEELKSLVDNEFKPFIFGSTDSETLFYLLLTHLKKKKLLQHTIESEALSDVLQSFVDELTQIVGPFSESKGDYDKNYLTFLLTNGDFMLGLQGGQSLRYSTHKAQCPESLSCSHFRPICVTRAKPGEKIHHLLISSEIIRSENIWNELKFGEFVGVAKGLNFFHGQVKF